MTKSSFDPPVIRIWKGFYKTENGSKVGWRTSPNLSTVTVQVQNHNFDPLSILSKINSFAPDI